jgi:excinuclease ABC subunit C
MDQSVSGRNIPARQEPAENLKKTAREAPLEAGVYIMRDKENRIIYVGKARVLRNRLSSYFSGEKDIKTSTLLRHAASIETIIVKDEYEALLLENTLIKQHSPKYNINLKDGKTYPMIRLSSGREPGGEVSRTSRPDRPKGPARVHGAYPRVFRTRHIIEDGSVYFGPFPNVGMVDSLLDIIDKVFPLRKCRVLRKRGSPCMYYHIGRCAAPCCGKISEAEYHLYVGRVRKLLSGESAPLIAELGAEMRREAAALRFERAAQLRNAVKAIEGLNGASAVVDFDDQGRDYLAWASEGVLTSFSVFSMRGGKLTGRELYRAKSASTEEESLESFIMAYYHAENPPPPRIFIQEGNRNREGPLKKWFRTQFDHEPEIHGASGEAPDAKHHEAILAMARQNAEEDLRRRLRERGAGPALDELRQVLKLKNRPENIEGFDIAQLDGKHPVASLISFKDGTPDRKNYRRFKLRSVVGVVDDFAAMREAVKRRYSRLLRENRELPDLILIDGGIGQVNAAKGVLDELGIDCDVAGLAKRDEELWLPEAKEPVRLSKRSEALKVLQFVRDESHRFATGLNQLLRSKDLRLESLESVEGIGPKRAAALLNQYGSIDGVAAAIPEEIAALCGCTAAAARAVRAAAKLAAAGRGAETIAARSPYSRSAADLAAQAAEGQTDYGGEAK